MGDLHVTAHMQTPSVGLLEHPVMLDGPLAWAWFQERIAAGDSIDPLTSDHAPDADLPLHTWEQGGTWGWCVSQADLDVHSYGAFELRRRPATEAMARFTTDREHHAALGPQKARNVTLASSWVSSASWDLDCTSRDQLEQLLQRITNLGSHPSRDMGRISRWEISRGHPGAWRNRPLPGPGVQLQAYRAPYWHPSRRIEATDAHQD